jgi:putative transposase
MSSMIAKPRRAGIEVIFSVPSVRIVRVLDQIIEYRGQSAITPCNNGPEYVGTVLQQWKKTASVPVFNP